MRVRARRPASGLDSQAVRARMVERLRAEGVVDPRVLAGDGRVPRHRFVDSALVNQAYEDTSLPIGLGQTISKPSVVARMIELLLAGRAGAAASLGAVLEIGTGCGYQAAVLSRWRREVFSIERLRGLHDKAREPARLPPCPTCASCSATAWPATPRARPIEASSRQPAASAVPEAWARSARRSAGASSRPAVMPAGQQALVIVDRTRA